MLLSGGELDDEIRRILASQGFEQLQLVCADGIVVQPRLDALDRPHEGIHLDGVL